MQRGALLVGLSCLVGCNSLVGTDEFTLTTCFGHLMEFCLPAAPAGDVVLMASSGFPPQADLDTSRDSRCVVVPQPAGAEVCVIAGATITVPATLRPTGKRPLVLIGSDSVTITGTLDLTSSQGGDAAGANATECPSGIRGTDGPNDAGGGAGGSLGGMGGSGAASQMGVAGAAPGAAITMPVALRGGCKGGLGGWHGNQDTGGYGGDGGGAVALISEKRVSVDGAVYAAGIGGEGGLMTYGGAGGGGSGGMIVIDAPIVSLLGTVAANGGGGGAGGDIAKGGFGQDGPKSKYMDAALGGQPPMTNRGGIGGTGGSIGKPAGSGAMPSMSGGGGGGGGGAGIVWLHGEVTGTKVSPTPIVD